MKTETQFGMQRKIILQNDLYLLNFSIMEISLVLDLGKAMKSTWMEISFLKHQMDSVFIIKLLKRQRGLISSFLQQ